MYLSIVFKGRRTGDFYCEAASKMAQNSSALTGLLLQALNLSCRTFYYVFWAISMSIPEIILYPITFHYITKHTKIAAMSGMLNQVNPD